MAAARLKPGWMIAAILSGSFCTTLTLAAPAKVETKPAAGKAIDPELRKKALALNNVTGTDPITGAIRSLAEDADASKKLIAAALEIAKEKDQPFNVTATYIFARVAQFLKDNESAEKFYRLNIEQATKMMSGQKVINGYTGLIQLCWDNRKFADCEKICQEVLDLDFDADDSVEKFKVLVLRQFILTLAEQDKFDKAHELTDKLVKANPDNWLNLQLKGDLLRKQNKLDEAAKVYEDIVEQVKNDKRFPKEKREEFADSFLYGLTGIYVDQNKIDKAAEILKALLEKKPDNPSYNNDLGYIWADHDMNLAESEKLVRKALEEDRKRRTKEADPDTKVDLDKDNASYLDSLGWVLFKQKKFAEAKPILEKAVAAEEGKHLEIYDHLAEVLLALGKKSEAVDIWKKGVAVASSNRRDQQKKVEVEKKIKANE